MPRFIEAIKANPDVRIFRVVSSGDDLQDWRLRPIRRGWR